jgi:UDP-glucose 4-epimerase
MRVLISGGFGFVGGRLAQHLHQAGHQVVLGSRTARSPPEWLREAEVAQINWNNCDAMASVCVGGDIIIHAAGMNAPDSAANPAEALAFNGVATARLLDAGSKARVKRFIYLSTAHVYSSPLEGTITEETCPRNLHPYATSHLAGESAVLYATQRKQIEGIVLRLSNVFGPPAHVEANCWMLLVNDLCRQAVETGQIVLKTSGNQLRDFIPMKNLCDTFQILTTRDDIWNRNFSINLGAGYAMSVISMAELIRQRCQHVIGNKPHIHRPASSETGAVPHLEFRTAKLAKLITLPSIDMESEIDELLRFCQRTFVKKRSNQA